MKDDEIKYLIEAKVKEAELATSEKRINYILLIAGVFVTVFGVVLPLLFAISNNDKVDQAVERLNMEIKELQKSNQEFVIQSLDRTDKLQEKQMAQYEKYEEILNAKSRELDEKFNQLAGNQLRKPKLVCNVKGTSENGILILGENERPSIEIRNVGDKIANDVKFKIYFKEEDGYDILGEMMRRLSSYDEPLYNRSYIDDRLFSIAPKESIYFSFTQNRTPNLLVEVPVLIKVYYDEPEPLRYSFVIKYIESKIN
ncbi:MAG: hypothetical protein HUU43_02480 [Ignavibacteriaceae bacterium]|nr:hypothetical protein [Ignavibacteriaceae bacterium]